MQTPFRCNNKKKTLDAILKKKLQIPYYISADAKDLLIRVSHLCSLLPVFIYELT